MVPPNTYMESLMTAAAWKSRPDGHCESGAGMRTDQTCESKSLKWIMEAKNFSSRAGAGKKVVLLAMNVIRQGRVSCTTKDRQEAIMSNHRVAISSRRRQTSSQDVLVGNTTPAKSYKWSNNGNIRVFASLTFCLRSWTRRDCWWSASRIDQRRRTCNHARQQLKLETRLS